jgi:two-component system sensor histidine kinase GlrK
LSNTHPILPFRVSLFWKIVSVFIGIILFMLTCSVVVLVNLKSLFSSDQSEFRIVPMTEQIGNLVESEKDLAFKFFQTHDLYNEQTLLIISNQFITDIDSLKKMIDREDLRQKADEALSRNRQYLDFLRTQITIAKENPRFDGIPGLQGRNAMVDSVRQPLLYVQSAYISPLSKSLRRLGLQTSEAIVTALVILMLSLVIAVVFAVLFARGFTRPIQSLKAGTEKVSQGQYETVPITSRDEIADLTKAFNLMSEKLRQLDEMRMQLMSEISHEMRTPLQVIKAGCYSIVHTKDSPPLTPRQREAVGMIHQATNRINQFVNSFLDIAKMEAGLMKFNFEESDIPELLTPLMQEGQLIAQSRNITVEMKAHDIPRLKIDRERMSQVFSNLLSNALKYTPDNGSITVAFQYNERCDATTFGGKGCVRIDVTDTGVGIPKEDLQKLFNKFFQAKNTPLVNEKGSGLGLALVKHVTEAHGGKVEVSSEVGKGSTFSILLPV